MISNKISSTLAQMQKGCGCRIKVDTHLTFICGNVYTRLHKGSFLCTDCHLKIDAYLACLSDVKEILDEFALKHLHLGLKGYVKDGKFKGQYVDTNEMVKLKEQLEVKS